MCCTRRSHHAQQGVRSGCGDVSVLGGSWDLVSKVISLLLGLEGIISIVTRMITLVTASRDSLGI